MATYAPAPREALQPSAAQIARKAADPGRSLGTRWIFLVLIVTTIAYFLQPQSSQIRPYVPLLMPIYLLGAFFVRNLVHAPLQTSRVIALSVAWFTLSILTVALFGEFQFDTYGVRKIFLPLAALLIAAFSYRIDLREMAVFNGILFVLSITIAVSVDAHGGLSYDLLSTDAGTESIFGLYFGALTVAFVVANRKVAALIAFLGCFILFKRNAIVAALLVSLILMVAHAPLGKRRLQALLSKLNLFMILFGMAVSLNIISALNHFFPLAGRRILEAATTGRYPIWVNIERESNAKGWLNYLFGQGPGAVERMLAKYPNWLGDVKLPHNEYLSLSYDFGIIGCFVFLMIWRRLSSRDLKASAIFLYLLIVFLVENVFLITLPFMAILILMQGTFVQRLPRRPGLSPNGRTSPGSVAAYAPLGPGAGEMSPSHDVAPRGLNDSANAGGRERDR